MERYSIISHEEEGATVLASADDLRKALNLEHQKDDGLLADLLKEALDAVETRTGLVLRKATLDLETTEWQSCGENTYRFLISQGPVISLTRVKVGETTATGTVMYKSRFGEATVDVTYSGGISPNTTITARYEAGVSGFPIPPSSLKRALLMIAAGMYEYREEQSIHQVRENPAVNRLLDPYRRQVG